jgi:phosphoribosylformylglycinamidine synthase subunit PurS
MLESANLSSSIYRLVREKSLHTLGYKEVQDVRVGKFVELNLQASSRELAEGRIREMCDKLLANPVIENFHYEISEG